MTRAQDLIDLAHTVQCDCGGHPTIMHGDGLWFVECDVCGRSPNGQVFHATEHEAAVTWLRWRHITMSGL